MSSQVPDAAQVIPSSLWARLLWVPKAADPALAEHGRFLAAMTLVALPAIVLTALVGVPLFLNPAHPTATATFNAALAMVAATVAAYVINRRGRTRRAARVFCLASIATLGYASSEAPGLLIYMPITILCAVALLPTAQALVIGLAAVLIAVPIGLFEPAEWDTRVLLPLLLNASFLPLALVVKAHQNRLERARADELARRERWFATTLSSIGDAVLTTDENQTVTFLNPIAAELTGFSVEQAIGRKVSEVFRIESEHTGDTIDSPVPQVLARREIVSLANHTLLIGADGIKRPIADSGAPIVSTEGTIYGVVLVFRDMTEERALRAQVEHSQRLDALGKLAGSVAHDFNNLLTAIGGGAQLAFDELPADHPVRSELSGVLDATQRAVGVTRQLLAFSRRQVMSVRPVELNAAVRSELRLLGRLLGTNVKIETLLDDAAGFVLVDPVQFEQVMLNLAMNAGDAMPRGGTLTLTTSFVHDGAANVDPPLPARDYGRLSVSDTGSGMDGATMQRIFEPFFTTKGQGHGTGLGLATVYGIVEQSEGLIRVRSRPGEGSTFDVFLPATEARAASADVVGTSKAPAGGLPRVMLVEDDDLVRHMAARVLRQARYEVMEAKSAAHSLELLDAAKQAPALLLTDVVMPGQSGVELAARLRERFPELPVLYMSGYANEIVAKQGFGNETGGFLPKPFTPEALRQAVGTALARPGKSKSVGDA
ncbi:MAG TPA: response regulator [Polyangiales bacterium]|nr:response regulator [Polyangiales bacterium]